MALFLLAAITWATVTAQSAQPFICTLPDPVPGGPPLPDLPGQFTARVEANIINRGYTVEVVEYYDVPNDRGRLETNRNRGGRGSSTTIYTLADKQFFRINTTDNTCTAHTISPRTPFSPFAVFDAQGNAHIRGIADFFRFGKRYGDVYVGREVVRGIVADHWQACANTSFGGNFTIDWYFAAANWSTSARQQPLRAVIEGADPQVDRRTRAVNMSMLHSFKHNYEFTVFKVGQPDPALFQIPRGIFCDGGKAARNFPTVPTRFSVRMQFFVVDGVITHAQEYYDSESQKFYFTGHNSRFGFYSTYQDLELGLLYYLNSSTCFTFNVSSLTLSQNFGERLLATQSPSNPSQLQLRSTNDLWGFSKGANVTYVGARTVNDVLCDVWQEERNDFGPNATIYEISFSKPSLGYWLSHKSSVEHQVPVRMELYSKSLVGKPPGQKQPWERHTYVNFFEFDTSPSMPDIDLASCYQNSATFWFSVQGTYSQVKDTNDFAEMATASIASSAGVHKSRMGHLHILPSSEDGSIVIEGTILDKPSVPTYKDTGAALDMAVNNLKQTINTRSGLAFKSGGISYTSQAQSFTQSPTSSSGGGGGGGYGAGAVAGVAIGMLIVGGLLGAVILYCVTKSRGAYQMDYKTQVD